jgi:hypothetical protein
MCTVLLPPGDNPIAANKYIIIIIIIINCNWVIPRWQWLFYM